MTNRGRQFDTGIDRRRLLRGTAATTMALALPQPAFSDSVWDADTTLPPLPKGMQDTGDFTGEVVKIELFGTQPPLDDEVKLARDIVATAPKTTRPLLVAEYFVKLGRGAFGADRAPYARAWPTRWNPVIVGFFEATQTKPRGDLTPWCAAFANWCILRSRDGRPDAASLTPITRNASSGSFRKWGKATTTPKAGDIAVFKSADPDDAAAGRGHVAFFLSETPTHVLVMGGNQFEGSPVRHAVNVKSIAKSGSSLILHSYRTDASL